MPVEVVLVGCVKEDWEAFGVGVLVLEVVVVVVITIIAV